MVGPEALSNESDALDPADINWTLADDAMLWHAANDGIPQAKAEMARRDAKPERITAAVKAYNARKK